MSTQPTQEYGWITCGHDDPDREEFTNEVFAPDWTRANTTGNGVPAYTYRKRPLAPDGKKFSDPKCEWEIVPESDLNQTPQHMYWALRDGEGWAQLSNASGFTASEWRSKLAVCAFASRKQPTAQAKQDGWKYFATDGPPSESDYPVVVYDKFETFSVYQSNVPSNKWNTDTVVLWYPLAVPPLPPKKTEAEEAWKKWDKTLNGQVSFEEAFLAGFNAARKGGE